MVAANLTKSVHGGNEPYTESVYGVYKPYT